MVQRIFLPVSGISQPDNTGALVARGAIEAHSALNRDSSEQHAHIHAGREAHLVRETSQSLEGRLDPARFLQIHCSTIVNLDQIGELQPMFTATTLCACVMAPN
jgi:hypothetical protein